MLFAVSIFAKSVGMPNAFAATARSRSCLNDLARLVLGLLPIEPLPRRRDELCRRGELSKLYPGTRPDVCD